MASVVMVHAAKRLVAYAASFVMAFINILSQKEERALTAEIEKWIVDGQILSITFSYPKGYPASKPCPERVAFRGPGWRAVYLEKGMKLVGQAPVELADLLNRLSHEHILNLQNLLRFLCEHSRRVQAETSTIEASSRILGYVHPAELSTDRLNLERAADQGFDPDFTWEIVKVTLGPPAWGSQRQSTDSRLSRTSSSQV